MSDLRSADPAPGRQLSVVVPMFNEADNVIPVLDELRAVLPDAEIIAVDDGSTDETWTRIRTLDGIRGLRLRPHLGQSAAIYHGARLATRPLVGLMDGDGQNDPRGFLLLLDARDRGAADVACGYRVHRRDPWNRRVAALVANGLRRAVLGDGVRDTGCAQKIFPRQAVECLIPFAGMHRYLPALFRAAGLRLVEVPLPHRPRRAGRSRYNNWTRAWHGVHDLVGVRWLLRRRLPAPTLETKP
jgi:dolichol-phosphate mannosyltransferase